MSDIKDLIPIVKATMEANGVRAFGEEIISDAFGVETVSVHVHFNDLRFCDIDKMFDELRVNCNAKIAYCGENNAVLIRPRVGSA